MTVSGSPAFDAAARTRSVVPERLQALVSDLARQYDPKLVLQAVARVSAA